jgi:hypothetical protein
MDLRFLPNCEKNIVIASNNIVDRIIDDLSDRSGIGDIWDSMAKHVQNEIREVWLNIIEEEVDQLLEQSYDDWNDVIANN